MADANLSEIVELGGRETSVNLEEIVEALKARRPIAAGGIFHVSFADGFGSNAGRAYEDIRRAFRDERAEEHPLPRP